MGLPCLACLVPAILLLPLSTLSVSAEVEAQRAVSPEVAQAQLRYRDQLQSSNRFDTGGLLPELPYGPVPKERGGLGPKKDAHAGLPDYSWRRCESCHQEIADNTHTLQGNLTCRQCHGVDPIASVDQYFSPMNSIRRHAYVCAKCHEGASASFATYVVHTSAAADPEKVRASFPALYWADVFMFALIIGVFLIFLPHGIAWWVREWFVKRKGGS